MKKQVILFLLLLPYLQVGANPPNNNIHFIEGQLSTVAQMAAREGKLYFVHFTAQWCMPCQWMEKNTFNDPELSQFANNYYLAVKIDIDQAEGQALKKEYLITNLPSILIFNAKGQLKARWETSLDAKQMLQILQKHNTVINRQPPVTAPNFNPEVLESPRPIFASTLSAPKPVFSEQTSVANLAIPPQIERPTQSFTPPSEPLSTKSFSIQVGVFSNYNNGVGEILRLETKIKQPINLVTGFQNGRHLYKVLVGNFNDRMMASAYLSQLRRLGINGIIKEMD